MPVIGEKFAPRMETNASCHMDVCRLCAQSNDPRSFIPLYTDDKRERIVAKQINQLVANLVSPDDGLPQKICSKCSKNVETCYSFVCNAIETQHKLKRLKRAAEHKRKRATDDESAAENYRLENVTLKDCDDSLNRRSVSKARLSLYDKTKTINDGEQCPSVIDLDCEQSMTNVNTTSTLSRRSQSQSQSLQLPLRQQQRSSGEGIVGAATTFKKVASNSSPPPPTSSCLYRCGVCLGKFATKDECIRHMMSSHTPPSSLSSVDDKNKLVSFDVVCKNGSELAAAAAATTASTTTTTSAATATAAAAAAGQQSHHRIKSNPQKSNLETTQSSQLKSRRKILNIDSFYKEMKKTCARYRCDVCGRLMTSRFAFKRHLREHRKTDELEDAVAVAAAAAKLDRQISAAAKPSFGHCRICNKLVKHIRRHNMYHTIVKLELDYPDFVKFLSV